jgi:hypothetical protein
MTVYIFDLIKKKILLVSISPKISNYIEGELLLYHCNSITLSFCAKLESGLASVTCNKIQQDFTVSLTSHCSFPLLKAH